MTSINDLQFDKALKLYAKKLLVEKRNDIRGRTQLLAEYPELFDPAFLAEMADVVEKIGHVKQSIKAQRKTLSVDFIADTKSPKP